MSEEPKPCPFCGGEIDIIPAHFESHGCVNVPSIICKKCHKTYEGYDIMQIAKSEVQNEEFATGMLVKWWNTRPAEDKKDYDLKALNFIYNKQAEAWENEIERLKAEATRFKRALHNLKEDCTRRKHFALSDEEKLFLYETISHIEAELDFNTDTGKGGEEK